MFCSREQQALFLLSFGARSTSTMARVRGSEFESAFCNEFDTLYVNADHFLLCHYPDPSGHFAPSGILPDTPSFDPTDSRPCSAGVFT